MRAEIAADGVDDDAAADAPEAGAERDGVRVDLPVRQREHVGLVLCPDAGRANERLSVVADDADVDRGADAGGAGADGTCNAEHIHLVGRGDDHALEAAGRRIVLIDLSAATDGRERGRRDEFDRGRTGDPRIEAAAHAARYRSHLLRRAGEHCHAADGLGVKIVAREGSIRHI